MKLDIIGSVASGKTTLARNLSETYHVPFYQKDNIAWERTPDGDKKRDDKERDQLFQKIINSDDWIVEGSPRKLLRESFEKCDYIILLDIPLYKRLVRSIRRWFRQKFGKEEYNSKPTVKFLCYSIKWVFEYEKDKKEIISYLSAYGSKYKRFTTSESAKLFISREYGNGLA